MEEVRVIKVTGSEQMNDFIQLPKKIYRNIPQYVPEFESDVRGLFDIKTNPGLEFSKIQPFVAYRGEEPVGRIVGIVNRKANKRWNLKNVRFSMIEFIDDYTVSRALIEAVEAWGMEFGMEKIHGPLGVTDFDKEGMLVEDFDLTGSMTAIYNPPTTPSTWRCSASRRRWTGSRSASTSLRRCLPNTPVWPSMPARPSACAW